MILILILKQLKKLHMKNYYLKLLNKIKLNNSLKNINIILVLY